MIDSAPEYVTARSVLLDALDALADHLGSLVLVGAQAIYLHVGAGDLAVAPMTTDADLAIQVLLLTPEPDILTQLAGAGF